MKTNMCKSPLIWTSQWKCILNTMNLLMLLLALVPVASVAQKVTYDSFLDEGKTWVIRTVGSNLEQTVSYTEYKLMGDATIDGVPYKQLFLRYRLEGEDSWSEWRRDGAYIGQDEQGRVYYYEKNSYSSAKVVTMDFSLHVGDEYRLDDYSHTYIVTAVSDTILENSFDRKPRRCIHLSLTLNGEIISGDNYRDVWIEGIGSVKYGLLGMHGNMPGGSCLLMKCTQPEGVIYQYDDAALVDGDYHPFVEEEKVWVMTYEDDGWSNGYFYLMQGDTVVAGQACKKLFTFGNEGYPARKYVAAMYETGKKVYFFPKGQEQAYLLYDFGVEQGQSFTVDDFAHPGERTHNMKVIETDTRSYDGTSRTCLRVCRSSGDGDMTSGWWFEGIGSEMGPLNTYDFEAVEGQHTLLGCHVNNSPICDNQYLQYKQRTIGGLTYMLNDRTHEAVVSHSNSWTGELAIPSQVVNNGESYTVSSIHWLAFGGCETLKEVTLPATIREVYTVSVDRAACMNPFDRCTALERIEVEEGSPLFCSVDGVLFTKDKKKLCAYPAGAKRESYAIPDGVTEIGGDAFSYNASLKTVTMPNCVTKLFGGCFSGCKSLQSIRLSESVSHIPAYAFENCESLSYLDIPESVTSFGESIFCWSPIKTLVIRGHFTEALRNDTFYCMDDEVILYVHQSEVEKFKKVFPGTVLPLESFPTDISNASVPDTNRTSQTYDLHGRRVTGKPTKGIYIQNGRKLLVK